MVAGYDEDEYAVAAAVVVVESVWILQTTSSSSSSSAAPVHSPDHSSVHTAVPLDLESRRLSYGWGFQLILFLLVVVVPPNKFDEERMTTMIMRRRSDGVPQLSESYKATIVIVRVIVMVMNGE